LQGTNRLLSYEKYVSKHSFGYLCKYIDMAVLLCYNRLFKPQGEEI